MSTEPLKSIIDRDLSIASAKELIEIACPLLHELVDFGSNALVRCAISSEGKINEDLASLCLFRHVLEVTDGVEVLLRQACAMPAIPLVRSAFEAMISMDYIVSDPSKYTQRSLAWLVDYIHKRIASYEIMDPSTTRGSEFQKSLQKDKSDEIRKMPFPAKTDIDKAADNLRRLLSDTQFVQIDQDFRNLKRKKAWFRLYNGPEDLKELAYSVGHSAMYDIMYRYWSRFTHAGDFAPFVVKGEVQGKGRIREIRDTKQLKTVTSYSATIFMTALRILISQFRPGEDYSTWYTREVRERYLIVTSRS